MPELLPPRESDAGPEPMPALYWRPLTEDAGEEIHNALNVDEGTRWKLARQRQLMHLRAAAAKIDAAISDLEGPKPSTAQQDWHDQHAGDIPALKPITRRCVGLTAPEFTGTEKP